MKTVAFVQKPLSIIAGYAERIISAVTDLIRTTTGHSVEYGGHLVVRERRLGSTVLVAKLGHLDEDNLNDIAAYNKAMERRIQSAEKAAARIWTASPLTSYYVGRAFGFGHRAGAIRGHNLIFSFYSEHDEFLDEAAMFVLAIRLRQLSEKDALAEINCQERNPHLRQLLEMCNWPE